MRHAYFRLPCSYDSVEQVLTWLQHVSENISHTSSTISTPTTTTTNCLLRHVSLGYRRRRRRRRSTDTSNSMVSPNNSHLNWTQFVLTMAWLCKCNYLFTRPQLNPHWHHLHCCKNPVIQVQQVLATTGNKEHTTTHWLWAVRNAKNVHNGMHGYGTRYLGVDAWHTHASGERQQPPPEKIYLVEEWGRRWRLNWHHQLGTDKYYNKCSGWDWLYGGCLFVWLAGRRNATKGLPCNWIW